MNYLEALRDTAKRLAPAAGEEAAREAGLLLRHAANLPQGGPGPHMFELFPKQYLGDLNAMISRRLAGEPVQYILGEWEFMGLPFFTRPCALIPRQDTETLAECALARGKKGERVLDLCCGTGCIGISLARLGGFEVDLADISLPCVELAKENAAKNGVAVRVIQSDLFKNVSDRYHMICSNPPYIPTGELSKLQQEVRFEPALALDGGDDGLSFYRRMREEYKNHLLPGGMLLLEVGFDQAHHVAQLFLGGEIIKDICGAQRVVIIKDQG